MGQTTLVSRGLVLVNNLLVGNAVDDTCGRTINFDCMTLVTRNNRFAG